MKTYVACGSSLVVAALLSAAVACGDSGSSGSATTPPGSDAGFSPDADTSSIDGGADGSDGAVVIDCPTPTGGPTTHMGEIKGEETWTAAGSPHIVASDVNVRDGAKLTIEPCAQVLLEKDQSLRVAFPLTPNTGTLIAVGSATHPIRFAGKDGARWGNVQVVAPGTARLAYVTLDGAGFSDGTQDSSTLHVAGDGVLPADPTVFLDHVTITGSAGTGLWMEGGATFVPGSTDLVVTGSGNMTSPYPVRIEEHSMDALPTGTFTGNKIDAIRLRTYGDGIAGDGLTVDATLHDRGVPYSMDGSFYVGKLGASRATMTIEAGVTMKFEAGTSLYIQKYTGDQPASAALVAKGTAAKPIVFTSASATPKAGDWNGLWFGGALEPTNQLDHVRIEYAGGDCLCSFVSCSDVTVYGGAVVLTNVPAGPFITNSTFFASAQHGVSEGFTGDLVNFRPTNTFTSVAGCPETLPRAKSPASCAMPLPACDGL